ncbi:MAG: Kynurenine formamidase [Phycisphaerae bacterium]|nr:Kynurenine formamidase [Phycisphaerae bacterium]
MIYDITPPISAKLSVWPGDTPPSRRVLLDLARGDTVTLSTLTATVHLGAHADAPNHYAGNAPSIEARSLEYYLGRCQVVRADVAPGARVAAADLRDAIREPRVLIATGTFPDPLAWNEDFAALEPDLVDDLHRRGVRLIGIDTPSVDLMHSKDLPAHARFLVNDQAILEGLVLAHVPSGSYELIALPLPLVGFDASPVRAVLRAL